MLVFTETSSGKYYRETRAIKYSEDARRRRDATLSNFQALPFARPILITFRVLKRNYLGPSPPAPPAPPSGNEARWKNKRKALSWGARCLCASQIWPISKRCWCNDFFSSFSRAFCSWAVAKWKAIKARASDLHPRPRSQGGSLPSHLETYSINNKTK